MPSACDCFKLCPVEDFLNKEITSNNITYLKKASCTIARTLSITKMSAELEPVFLLYNYFVILGQLF